ncbi:hypothetical protein G9A89_002168 [Geosiphon pyriformis]|nr:hypothetical protein G9A89_002168 [Geosiphon pyriformis]
MLSLRKSRSMCILRHFETENDETHLAFLPHANRKTKRSNTDFSRDTLKSSLSQLISSQTISQNSNIKFDEPIDDILTNSSGIQQHNDPTIFNYTGKIIIPINNGQSKSCPINIPSPNNKLSTRKGSLTTDFESIFLDESEYFDRYYDDEELSSTVTDSSEEVYYFSDDSDFGNNEEIRW